MLAYVVGLRSVKADELGFPVEKLRSLGPHAPSLDLPPSVLALVEETAQSTLSPMPSPSRRQFRPAPRLAS